MSGAGSSLHVPFVLVTLAQGLMSAAQPSMSADKQEWTHITTHPKPLQAKNRQNMLPQPRVHAGVQNKCSHDCHCYCYMVQDLA